MQYLLLLYDMPRDRGEAEIEDIISGHKEFTRSIRHSGKYRDSNALAPRNRIAAFSGRCCNSRNCAGRV